MNSRLLKLKPPLRTTRNQRVARPMQVGFCLDSSGFSRQSLIPELTFIKNYSN
ncbi:hypothetical protein H6G89_17575 [Oscillatoria sp. FACHB-1407]|uniref:hypothetical protein n=1 Tax=Oscillatoria sp. FACHB-1407 TaxID=2692847 RepID=UPI001688C892|nr:hypothetical protein [Oscillatoria sp. FACHB-1407]MBD2462853.1 hypothetical protein [Oscillatoria sp. FACHB-1407]